MKVTLAINQEKTEIKAGVVQAVADLNNIIDNINGATTAQIKAAISILAQNQKRIIKRLVQIT